MTRLRSVGPKRACDARSSSPMYASTSTIRPTRRRAPGRRGRRHGVTDEPRAEERAGRLERRLLEAPRAGTGWAGLGDVRRVAVAGHPARSHAVELEDRLRDEERDDAEEGRDHVLVEDPAGLGPVDRVPDVAQERQLVVVLGDARVEVVLVEEDRDEQQEQRRPGRRPGCRPGSRPRSGTSRTPRPWCTSPGRRGQRDDRRRRRSRGTRSSPSTRGGYCVQFWLRKPPSQKALSWSARKNENVIDRMPMSRRMAPWA